jgi:hypothetical protein
MTDTSNVIRFPVEKIKRSPRYILKLAVKRSMFRTLLKQVNKPSRGIARQRFGQILPVVVDSTCLPIDGRGI